jgi:hypothetical protein
MKQILEDLVEALVLPDGTLGRAALVVDGDGGAVGFGLADRVPVDVLTEDVVGALARPHDDGRAREADAGGVGQRPEQVAVERAGMGAVGFVDDHHDVRRLVQHGEHGRLTLVRRFVIVGVPVLLDHGEHEIRPVAGEQLA